MTHLASLVLAYMEKNYRGRARAIPRDRLLVEFVWLYERLTDRQFRRLYAEELPVVSCEDGLFIPETSAEVAEFETYLSAKLPPWKVRERIERIHRFYPKLRPEQGEQMGLFEKRLP